MTNDEPDNTQKVDVSVVSMQQIGYQIGYQAGALGANNIVAGTPNKKIVVYAFQVVLSRAFTSTGGLVVSLGTTHTTLWTAQVPSRSTTNNQEEQLASISLPNGFPLENSGDPLLLTLGGFLTTGWVFVNVYYNLQ